MFVRRTLIVLVAALVMALLACKSAASIWWFNAGNVMLNRGLAQHRRPSLERAEALLELAAGQGRESGRVWRNLGLTRLALGDYTGSEGALMQARQLDPEPLVSRDLGALYRATGRLDMAAAQWRSAGDAVSLLELAEEAEGRQRWAEAERWYSDVLAIVPDNGRAMGGLGRALFRGRGDPNAEGYLRRAVALEPTFMPNYLELGELCRSQGRYEEAATWFERARATFPASELPLVYLGGNLFSQRRWAEAIPYLEQAVALNPASVFGRDQLGRAYQANGQLEAAEQELRSAVDLAPNDLWGHELLGRLYQQEKRYDLAEAEYRTAIDIAPGQALYHALLGDLYRDQGRKSEAIEAYRKALQLDGHMTWVVEQINLLTSPAK